jgi:hypothetical protein
MPHLAHERGSLKRGPVGEIGKEMRQHVFAIPEEHALGICCRQLRIGSAAKLMRGLDEFQDSKS